MKKLYQLNRLDFDNIILFVKYIFKRILRLKTTKDEKQINEFYFHLIQFNGYLKEENENDFVFHYPNYGTTLKLRKRPSSDLNVFAQIYHYKEYQSLVETFREHFPKKESLTIIDAGSNIGLTSVYLNHFFPNSNFITIEPDTSNFENVCYNLKANGIKSAININGGLWSRNTNLKIVKDFRDKKDWSIRVLETSEPTDLKAFSINFLLEENNIPQIDIFKMDIEGSEKEVLLSSNAEVSYLSKTKCVAIEIHDEFNCRQDIYNLLEKYNFKYFNSGELTIGINQNLL
jgi:FkbM family methyltransferase